MILQKFKPFIRLAIIIGSTLVSYFYIAPAFEADPKLSALYGFLGGIILALIIFPVADEEGTDKKDENESPFGDYFKSLSHPTNLPLTYSMIFFLILVALIFILKTFNLNIVLPQKISTIILSTLSFLWGYSGFLMVRRNEYIDKSGRQYKGFWAYFNGILLMLWGWGMFIALLIFSIIDL